MNSAPSDFFAKMLVAIEQDILPLQAAAAYPKRALVAFDESMLFSLGRERYIANYGYVLLSAECLEALVQMLRGHKVLDAGSGGGYLSHCLGAAGVDVTAVELHPPETVPTEQDPRRLWQVDIAGCARQHVSAKYDVVIVSWPGHQQPFAFDIATALAPGQVLVYQGEGSGGCTANPDFFELVADWPLLEDETRALNAGHVQFHGVKDRWYVLMKPSA